MRAWVCDGSHPGVDLPISVPKGEACSDCGAREPVAATALRLTCWACGRKLGKPDKAPRALCHICATDAASEHVCGPDCTCGCAAGLTIPVPRSAAALGRRQRAWRNRKLTIQNHGRVQGGLIIAARMFKSGSLPNRALYRAADLWWFHMIFKPRWGKSGY